MDMHKIMQCLDEVGFDGEQTRNILSVSTAVPPEPCARTIAESLPRL